MEDFENKNQPIADDGVYFSIREVAEQVGVTPATIRNWEKKGLFVPNRSGNGYRQFSFGDIDVLRRIKQRAKNSLLVSDLMRMGLGISRPATALQREESGVSRRLLSNKWKESRLERNYSLEDVAKAISISPSYLSKIENMQANISLDILKRLAEFYGENILYYIGSASEETNLVKKGEGDRLSIGIAGVDIESITALSDFAISAMVYHIQPGSGRQDISAHSGQEFVHVLSGSIRFTLGDDRVFRLQKGDSLSFRSSEAHRWYNNTAKPASLLWIYVPVEG